jgi:hypothetical protein
MKDLVAGKISAKEANALASHYGKLLRDLERRMREGALQRVGRAR